MAAFRENEGGGRLTVTARDPTGSTVALQSGQILKSRNPNSVVRLKDLKTGGRDRHRVQVGATIMKMLVLPQRPIAGLAQVQEPAGAGGSP
jgi:hypothetical protein